MASRKRSCPRSAPTLLNELDSTKGRQSGVGTLTTRTWSTVFSFPALHGERVTAGLRRAFSGLQLVPSLRGVFGGPLVTTLHAHHRLHLPLDAVVLS